MRVRVFYLAYHMDGEELESAINELIETCEQGGDQVFDLDLKTVPIKTVSGVHEYYGTRYQVLLKVRPASDANAG